MDYEKNYKDAFGLAKDWYNDATTSEKERRLLAAMFHELKESEDERIRTRLIALVEAFGQGEYKNEMLAYLEKQKELAVIPDELVKNYKLFCEQGGRELALLINAINGFNKQKEQPAEWSEKDEGLIDLAVAAVEDFYDKRNPIRVEIINFLSSLRPQPKVELTLLDENIIKAAVAFVEQNDHFNCWGGIDKHTVIKALRSLKPHWKPSEEQMKSLSTAYRLGKLGKTDMEVLQSLYEQLKRL